MDGKPLVEALEAEPLKGKEYDARRRDMVSLAAALDNREGAAYTTTLGEQLRLFATMDKLIMDSVTLALESVERARTVVGRLFEEDEK